MRVVTFHKGTHVRTVVRWMLLEADNYHRTEIRVGNFRRLPMDMTYPYEDDFDWIQAAHDLAKAHGLVLWRDHLGTWRIRVQTWKAMKAEILRDLNG